MARIHGVNLPDDKRIEYAITLIYGVGPKNAVIILSKANISGDKRVKDLTEDDIKRIATSVEENYKVEGVLKEEINNNIKRLREIASYRGMRHVRGLPSRGQRTKSNARTKRGKRKTVGALKKEDMMKVQAATTTAPKK